MTEAELKRRVVAMAKDAGWLVFSLPMIRNTRPVVGADGYPDLTLARSHRVLFIELKQQDAVLSPQQMRWLREIGPDMLVVRPDDVDGLARWLA